MAIHRMKTVAMVLAGCFWASAAWAEDPPPPGKAGEPRRPMRPMRGSGVLAPGAVEGLLDGLSLDEAQRKQIEDRVKEIRDKFNEKRMQHRLDPEQAQKAQDIQMKLREAREAGDQEKMKQLREEMSAMFSAQREMQQQVEKEMHDAIVALLRPDQTEAFETAWNDPSTWRSLAGDRRVTTLRQLRRVVLLLPLEPGQRKQVSELFDEHFNAHPPPPDRGAPTDPVEFAEVRSKVEALLTEEQKRMLATRLEFGGRRGPMVGRRPPRPGEPSPSGEEMPPPPPDNP